MKRTSRWSSVFLGALVVGAPFFATAQEEKATAVNLDTELAKQSYSIGVRLGKSITEPGLEIDLEALLAGFQTTYNGEEPALSDEEMMAAMSAVQQNMQALMQKKQAEMQMEQAEAGSKALEEGQAYLAANAKKEGVVVTESGLQYNVVKEGTGPIPGPTDRVRAHYTGTFVDGTEFDSSKGRDPIEFAVAGGVIPGWIEAAQLMPVGSVWELAIPSDLAYGSGRGPIPPNAVLLFTIELLEIVK